VNGDKDRQVTVNFILISLLNDKFVKHK